MFAQRLELPLPLVPDDVDLGVIGDGFERDVRYALVNEAVADVAARRVGRRRRARDLGLCKRVGARGDLRGLGRTEFLDQKFGCAVPGWRPAERADGRAGESVGR